MVPFSETELENFVLKVGRTRRGVRKIESPEMQLARKFGGQLFGAVMQGKTGELYRTAASEARATGQGLRITLSLTDVPELGGIPWEYLYDDPNFLSINAWTPVVRYLDLPKPRRALEVELPLRILGVISNPLDAEPLDVDVEKAKLENALKPLTDANAVTIDWLEEPTLLALAKRLRPDTYHILHFIGHGGFDDANGEGALLFEDAAGRGRAVSGDQLAAVLYEKRSLRLVLLNSCEGARNSVKDPFSGVAASLVQREIPAVIGMQFEITDRAAVLFASEFYAMLAEGQPIDFGDFGSAPGDLGGLERRRVGDSGPVHARRRRAALQCHARGRPSAAKSAGPSTETRDRPGRADRSRLPPRGRRRRRRRSPSRRSSSRRRSSPGHRSSSRRPSSPSLPSSSPAARSSSRRRRSSSHRRPSSTSQRPSLEPQPPVTKPVPDSQGQRRRRTSAACRGGG